MSEEELTPLEVIIQNAMVVKTEIISAMMMISKTTKEYDRDLERYDTALNSDLSEEAKAEVRAVREGISARKAKYLSEVLISKLDLRELTWKINDQLTRQVPTEKRALLMIDFDLLIRDCEEEQTL